MVYCAYMLPLGEQIKRLREERGLTQEVLASRAKLSRIYIAKLEAGDRASPSFPALQRIARALGVKLRIDLVK
jgi:transcriptional regulator with XRE-family HTH domain